MTVATDSDSLAPALYHADRHAIVPRIDEPVDPALVADLAPEDRKGWAFGIYNAVLGVGALVASVLFGALWTAFGPWV